MALTQLASGYFAASSTSSSSVTTGDWIAPIVALQTSKNMQVRSLETVTNGSFTNNLEGWELFGQGSVQQATASTSSYIQLQAPGWAEQRASTSLTQMVQPTEHHLDTLVFQVRVPAVPVWTTATLEVLLNNESYYSTSLADLSESWEPISISLEQLHGSSVLPTTLTFLVTQSTEPVQVELTAISTRAVAVNPLHHDVYFTVQDVALVSGHCNLGTLIHAPLDAAFESATQVFSLTDIPIGQHLVQCGFQDTTGHQTQTEHLLLAYDQMPVAPNIQTTHDESDGEVTLEFFPGTSEGNVVHTFEWVSAATQESETKRPISLLPAQHPPANQHFTTAHSLVTFTDLEPGEYEVTALAIDPAGNTASSAPIVVSVASSATDSLQPVRINEIQWAGSVVSGYDEWIELKNQTATPISLSGWQIHGLGRGGDSVTLPSTAQIDPFGYYLVAHFAPDSESTLLKILADAVVPSLSLTNTGEILELLHPDGRIIDETPAGSWSAGSTSPFVASMQRRNSATGGRLHHSWFSCMAPACATPTFWKMPNTSFGTPGEQNR